MPDMTNKVTKHRRVQEKLIIDFVEWLNVNDFLQNLAFGEKIIKYTDGFHVAIESIKRTKSVTYIIKEYYRNFMNDYADKFDENVDGNIANNVMGNDQNYESDENDSDDEDDIGE